MSNHKTHGRQVPTKVERVAKIIAAHPSDRFTSLELNDPNGMVGNGLSKFILAHKLAVKDGTKLVPTHSGSTARVVLFRKNGVEAL